MIAFAPAVMPTGSLLDAELYGTLWTLLYPGNMSGKTCHCILCSVS